ncbi:MAG: polysaccharide biosynthesis C-terminal domain-containing protein [Candidatus Delongbacteria bacterium]|nr:polysaccharide biosynthesis C-terminal domain-containing protein [Candidatus Delongbacteria bacterium]
MFKSILNTLGTRFISALTSFILLITSANYLGAAGNGVIGTLLTCIGLLMMINGIAGGSALVYLMPQNPSRHFFIHTLIIAATWSVITCSISCLVLGYFNYIPHHLIIHGMLIGLLACNSLFHALILLANEKVSEHNMTTLLQVVVNTFLFILITFITSQASVKTYLITLYCGYGISYLYSCWRILALYRSLAPIPDQSDFIINAKRIIYYGFISQISNLIQFLNYRLSIFVLNRYVGEAEIGVFYYGIRLSEAIWMISSSISLVLYTRIANTINQDYKEQITLNLTKISFIATFLSAMLLIIIPLEWFTFILSRDFYQVHQIILVLSPGIVFFSISTTLSHYFAGQGKYQINTYANLSGLIITLTGNAFLVPKMGIIGAGIVSSVSYITNTILLIFIWTKLTHRPVSNFLVHPHEIAQLYQQIIKNKTKNLPPSH